ncbi:MAG: alpha-glycosidase, partial [Clostridium baratii]|nr:alpha-glycosidase [Clostridium baratii]
VGMEGDQGMGKEFHRRCMIWDEDKQDKDMFKFMKRIIEIRKENSEFKLLDNTWINASREDKILVYSKGNIVIIINNSNVEEKILLPNELINKEVINLFENKTETLEREITLEPYEFKIYK